MRNEDIEIKPIVMSEETKAAMAKFFMETSIPRIINDYKKKTNPQQWVGFGLIEGD